MPGYYNKDGRGCKPTSSVRFQTCNADRRYVRFSFSEDIILRLGHYGEPVVTKNYQRLYLEVERFPWIAPHALLVRLTTFPTTGNQTFKISKQKTAPRYVAEIHTKYLEVQRGAPGATFTDLYWDDDRRGLMLQFPIEIMTEEAQERWQRIARWRKLKEAAAG